MNNHVYKTVMVTGSSKTSMEDAIKSAIDKAGQTVRNLRWFEVTETRGFIENQKIAYWQVTMNVSFTLDDAAFGPLPDTGEIGVQDGTSYQPANYGPDTAGEAADTWPATNKRPPRAKAATTTLASVA